VSDNSDGLFIDAASRDDHDDEDNRSPTAASLKTVAPSQSTAHKRKRATSTPNQQDEVQSSAKAKEAAILEKYGTLYAADNEKMHRRSRHQLTFDNLLFHADKRRLKAQHLNSRVKLWKEKRKSNEGEMEKCRERIRELEEKNEEMAKAEEDLREVLGEEAEMWERDKEKIGRWQAFFELDDDEVEE
jgi:hypothetical protein